MSEFTSKQKEIVARKLGYDGPMQGFDEFVASSPALQARYNMVTQKYVERMAKGGMVKKYAAGGDVSGQWVFVNVVEVIDPNNPDTGMGPQQPTSFSSSSEYSGGYSSSSSSFSPNQSAYWESTGGF